MNLKNILKEESTVIYVGEEIEKSDTQETLLQGFIVHSPKLGVIKSISPKFLKNILFINIQVKNLNKCHQKMKIAREI